MACSAGKSIEMKSTKVGPADPALKEEINKINNL
jgi:hypothetical protein